MKIKKAKKVPVAGINPFEMAIKMEYDPEGIPMDDFNRGFKEFAKKFEGSRDKFTDEDAFLKSCLGFWAAMSEQDKLVYVATANDDIAGLKEYKRVACSLLQYSGRNTGSIVQECEDQWSRWSKENKEKYIKNAKAGGKQRDLTPEENEAGV